MKMPIRRIMEVFYTDKFSADGRVKLGRRFSWKRFLVITGSTLLVLKILLLLSYYNTFISMQYDVEESLAQIDTQMQRRKNIILNVNAMVIEYARHEKDIFKHVTNTRRTMVGSRFEGHPADVMAPDLVGENLGPEALEAWLSNIFAIAERYPDLRLSENFRLLMEELVDVESKVAEERMIYNRRANDMSTAVGKFPGFIFAKMYGFDAPLFYEAEPGARTPPQVEYSQVE